jgi:hypothetical protein
MNTHTPATSRQQTGQIRDSSREFQGSQMRRTNSAGVTPRHPRFTVLDRLIALGYGSMPYPQIVKLERKCGGVLPPRVDPEDETPEEFEPLTLLHQRKITTTDAIIRCVAAGLDTTWDVEKALSGIAKARVVRALMGQLVGVGRLRKMGKVRVTRSIRQRDVCRYEVVARGN